MTDSPPPAAKIWDAPWDEMVAGEGRLRPGWSSVLSTLSGLGREALAGRAAQLDRIAAEEGVTSLLPGAEPSTRHCDPIPLLLGAAEFAMLEAGLTQRARLLDAVLTDIYGPQRLLASGALPPALVYANPAFLRPCRAGKGEAGPPHRLQAYAAELLRGPDGVWRVLADRTADAAGIAYAIENRRALVRVMPELFRAQPPRRLSPFFEAWQDALLRLAPEGNRNPGLVLLTSGPTDKLWFEHVVLARELSCTLVEGGDLTVRGGELFLKTLRGLQKVHVVLRRQDGRTLDPLELDPWSRDGVTGLMSAVRAGTVRVVNDPGTGCAEAPGVFALLPALAHALLGEELALPSVPTVWLGDAEGRARVLRDLTQWRIRPALDGTAPPVLAARLSPAEREDLAARIAACPEHFVAQALLPPSVAPCVVPESVGAGFVPRPLLLRMFLTFDGAQWRTLPGGLARALSPEDPLSGRLPLHALSKDVWVAAEDEADLLGPAFLRVPPLAIRRTAGDLPSRVADNFFWLGRYLERLDGTARLLRAGLVRLERPTPTPRQSAELNSLVRCLVGAELLPREAAQGLGSAALSRLLQQTVRTGGVIPRALGKVSHLTELLRDRLTQEVHTTVVLALRSLGEALAPAPPPEARDRADGGWEFLHGIAAGILTFTASVAGLAAENMVRSGGRLFFDLGRRVERAWATAGTMACVLDVPGADRQPGRLEPALSMALELCDSVITYRSRYLSVLQAAPVLDLVLADEGNPRGLAFQFAAARDILAELAGDGGAALPTAAESLLETAQGLALDVVQAVEDGSGGDEAAAALPPRLRALEAATAELSDRIARRYFALLPPARGLGFDLGAEEPARGELRGAA